ncbi:MAG: sigma-70 family RNA polymerase sigma factor [Acidimicrobiia bacterium]|nr:sigma-70 family RNA polymerase sigma factor [Acidimicrobiia bacterium]
MTLAWEERERDLADNGTVGFDELYGAHRRRAYRLALILCGGERVMAEDALSEAFVRVLRRWRGGGIEEFGPYLRRAVVNEVRRAFTRRELQRRTELPVDSAAVEVPSPEDQVVRLQVVLSALKTLPVQQRTASVLRYYEGLPVEAVAQAMGTSVGTAKVHLSRGRDRLRSLLEGQL